MLSLFSIDKSFLEVLSKETGFIRDNLEKEGSELHNHPEMIHTISLATILKLL